MPSRPVLRSVRLLAVGALLAGAASVAACSASAPADNQAQQATMDSLLREPAVSGQDNWTPDTYIFYGSLGEAARLPGDVVVTVIPTDERDSYEALITNSSGASISTSQINFSTPRGPSQNLNEVSDDLLIEPHSTSKATFTLAEADPERIHIGGPWGVLFIDA